MGKTNIIGRIARRYSDTSLILRILIGMVAGAALGLLVPTASFLSLPGTLFVSALKAIAPVLVFVLVISSLANGQTKFDQRFGFVIFEYLFSTFLAAMVAVDSAALALLVHCCLAQGRFSFWHSFWFQGFFHWGWPRS